MGLAPFPAVPIALGRGLDRAATTEQRIYDDGLGTDSPEWKDQ